MLAGCKLLAARNDLPTTSQERFGLRISDYRARARLALSEHSRPPVMQLL